MSYKNIIKVGDTVMWKGCFGNEHPKEAVVVSMEVTKNPREKYGEEVQEVSWDLVFENRVIFNFNNNHWAYSDQISKRCKVV